MVAFYNAADQELYKDFQFVPQEKYRTGFTAPVQGGGQDASTPSFGIPNTNVFTNSGNNSFNSAGNVFGYGSQIEPVSYGQYGAPGYMGGLPGNVQQYGIGRQFEDPSASPIGETYSYKKTVPGFARVAAGFIPFGNTALNFLEKRMNSNRDQSGSYSVAGLNEAQKGAYNNLAGEGMLFDGPSGLKTLTGKNFTGKGYMEGQIELAKEFGFDNMTDQEIEDAINAQGLANQNKFNTKNKGFKYKQMLEASKMFETNKGQQEKEAKDLQDKIDAENEAAANRGRIESYTGRPMSDYRASRPRSEQNFTGGGPQANDPIGGFENKSGMGRTGYFHGGLASIL
mgnify:FL=1